MLILIISHPFLVVRISLAYRGFPQRLGWSWVEVSSASWRGDWRLWYSGYIWNHMESYGYIQLQSITYTYNHIYILLISTYIYLLHVISQLQQTLRSCGSPAGEQKWRVFRCGCIDLPVLGRSDPQRDGKGDELTGLRWFASHVITNYRYYRLMKIMENERASNSMRRVLKPNNQVRFCPVELDSSSRKIAGSKVAALCHVSLFGLGFIDLAMSPFVAAQGC